MWAVPNGKQFNAWLLKEPNICSTRNPLDKLKQASGLCKSFIRGLMSHLSPQRWHETTTVQDAGESCHQAAGAEFPPNGGRLLGEERCPCSSLVCLNNRDIDKERNPSEELYSRAKSQCNTPHQVRIAHFLTAGRGNKSQEAEKCKNSKIHKSQRRVSWDPKTRTLPLLCTVYNCKYCI